MEQENSHNNSVTHREVVIVGAGIAGITAAACAAKAGVPVLVCEQQPVPGGLVNSFTREGFLFDGGIRSMEDSGVLFSMLRHLGIDIEMVRSRVSVGIGKSVLHIESEADLEGYRQFLTDIFPESADDIRRITAVIKSVKRHMDTLYGIDNPAFHDFLREPKYLFGTLLPWMIRYAVINHRIRNMQKPVEEFLAEMTDNSALIDMIAQHFFTRTPAFFALSYFRLYLDYHYPLGGTGKLVEKMVALGEQAGAEFSFNRKIVAVNPRMRELVDQNGDVISYDQLIWTADNRLLYDSIDDSVLHDTQLVASVRATRTRLASFSGGESVLTLYAAVNLPPEYFDSICNPHFFYTASSRGLSSINRTELDRVLAADSEAAPPPEETWVIIREWLQQCIALNTFEISIPVLRDHTLAPEEQSGIVASILFPYDVTRLIIQIGKYEEFKDFCRSAFTDVLNDSIFPGLRDALLFSFMATPATMYHHSGNSDGAITGWAFTGEKPPAETSMMKIFNAVETSLPDIYQAGQWTFSPAGFPISIITGKLAADKVVK